MDLPLQRGTHERRGLVTFSRRLALALLGGGALAFANLRRRRQRSPVLHRVEARELDHFDVSARERVAAPAGALRFLAIGDIGWNSPGRARVVAEMKLQMAAFAPRFALLLGDNFYRDGIASLDDPRWQTDFEQLFEPATFPIPFRACLGNHDYGGDILAQVEYTRRSSRWRMPARYYTFAESLTDDPRADCQAQVFVLDTQPIWLGHDEADAQLEWLERELARSTARWKLVVGHHCLRSGGEHGPMFCVAEEVEPLLRRHGVDLYLSGHDHDQQLLDSGAGWLHLISGTGSSVRDTGWTAETLFAAAQPGFAVLELTPDEMKIHFCEAGRGRVFSREVRKELATHES